MRINAVAHRATIRKERFRLLCLSIGITPVVSIIYNSVYHPPEGKAIGSFGGGVGEEGDRIDVRRWPDSYSADGRTAVSR